MKYFLIFIILIGFLIPSITFAQYLGDVEFYHLPLTVESKQYSILAQSNTNHFTDVVYDSKAHSLIFSTSLSEDFIDTYTITMNVQTFSEVLATDYAKTSDSMVVLVNGVDQPYKTIEDNEIISWIFYAPISSDEVELLPSSPRFGTGTYKFDKIPNGSPKIYPPLKQDHVGIATENIQCKDELLLLQKHDGSPACVKPESINILVHRGWADEKFRTLPTIDFQNPDRIFREVGYLGLMMLLPHIEENQTVAISLEGKPNMILPIIQYYEIEILSEKTNTNESFSSVFGKITKPNLQKFFEENPMNLFVKRGVLLTSLGGYQDSMGTYGSFNQFLTDNESQIIGDALTYYENKRTNGEDVHFDDFVKWPTGKLNESFLQKSKLLDIASIEENRIALNPTDTCAHISLRLLSADKLEQYQSRDKEVRFFEITETDLKELPVLDELIQATNHLEFTTNDDAHAEMGLRELVDYEFFIMDKAIEKYNDSQDDYFLKLDGNLDEKLADPKPQGFSNEFLSPQLVYGDKVYVLSHTFFWVANEHETQHMSVHLQDSLDNNKKFITLTDKDMKSLPKIKQAIEKIGTEFESIHASKGLPENPDWNEYREWFVQKKTEQFNLDETYVPGFLYNDEYYDLGFPIC